MAVYSIITSKVEIGAAVAMKSADFIAADFTTPLTAAVEVKEPKTLGSVMDEWGTTEFSNVTDGRTRTLKLFKKGKPVELVFGNDPTDAGQLAVRAAALVDANYAFRMSFGDKPASGASPKPSTRLFIGTILSVEDDPSGEHHVLKVTIQPNSNIIATQASAT
jgi:hypothetical protein